MTLIDVFDIALFSFFVYGLIVLLKETKSLFAVFGIGIVAIVYAVAEFFNLRLTATAFHFFFSAFVIGIVIIFQAELRRYFELIAAWGGGLRVRRVRTIQTEYIENIVSVAERFAREKVGMLLVFAGRESVVRHTQGGFDLNGKISEPILESIFDASSPGHDGAVIIEGDTIVKFGVHLPLSKDFGQIEMYGTRHSAGLGIAEVSDALAVIVSEEKGSISVAQNGALRAIADAYSLREAIEHFIHNKFGAKPLAAADGLFVHGKEKITAVLISAIAWFILIWPHAR